MRGCVRAPAPIHGASPGLPFKGRLNERAARYSDRTEQGIYGARRNFQIVIVSLELLLSREHRARIYYSGGVSGIDPPGGSVHIGI